MYMDLAEAGVWLKTSSFFCFVFAQAFYYTPPHLKIKFISDYV